MKTEIEKTKKLTPKEESFCIYYTSIGADTFCHGTLSAERAGYAKASARTAAWKLLRVPKIRSRIMEIHAENMSRNFISIDKVLNDLEHDKALARAKGDISSAIRADELQGKYLSMFSNKHVFAREHEELRVRDIDPEEREDLLAISSEYYNRKFLAEAPKPTGQKIPPERGHDPP